MAVVTVESRNELTSLHVAMFDLAPGGPSLSALVAAAESGKTLLQIATELALRASFSANFPPFMTGEEFANKLVAKMLPGTTPAAAVAWATNWVLTGLGSGKSRVQVITEAVQALRATANPNYVDAKAQLANKVEVSLYYAIVEGKLADSSTTMLSGVTHERSTVVAALNEINPGDRTFSLSTGTDNLTGDGGDNTFSGITATLTAGDKIDGRSGSDKLILKLAGTAPAVTFTNIETLELTATPNPATLNLAASSGVTAINNLSSANGATLTVTNVSNVVNTTLTGSQAATTIEYTSAAVAGTSDASTLTLAGTTAGATFTANGVETITIASTMTANTLTTLSDNALKALHLTGDKNLTITNAVGGATIATVDASTATGAIKLSTGAGVGGASATGVTVTGPTATGSIDVTTGANKDTVVLGAGNNVVDTAGGNDTITAGIGANTIAPGAGNDLLTLTGTKDTLRYADAGPANADSVIGFSPTTIIALHLGAAQNTTAAASAGIFGAVQSGATTPTLPGVGGTGSGTTVALQSIAPNATATTGTVLAGSTVLALNNVYTDGTVAGVISALGTTATTGIATTATGKFVLVTYSVGNVAQIWAYGGDTTLNTNIDEAELSLVATLNGVAQNAITASNFSSYLTPNLATTAMPNEGQSINITAPLNTVQSTPNASSQFLTAANDTINVTTGMLPTGTATATMGLTLLDPSSIDADIMNASVLGDWAAGTLVAGIETINLNMLTNGTTFSATSRTPGTTQFGLTGIGHFVVTGLPNASGITLGSGYASTAALALATATGGSDSIVINLNGSTATSATVGAAITNVGAGVETATINVNATSSIRMSGANDATVPAVAGAGGAGLFGQTAGDVAAINLAGIGDLIVYGSPAALDTLLLNGSGVAYSGSLTLRAVGANNDMNFATVGTGAVTGIKTLDLQDAGTYAGTITFSSTNTTNGILNVTINNNTTTAATAQGAVTLAVQNGGSQSDAVTINEGANVASIGTLSAAGIESLTLNSARAVADTFTTGAITLTNGPGTQKLVVTGASSMTIGGQITADAIDFSGTTGLVTLSASPANNAGISFTGGSGGTAWDSVGSGTSVEDVLIFGSGNDALRMTDGDDTITTGAGTDIISYVGLGNRADNVNAGTGPVITDFTTGLDKIRFDKSDTGLGGTAPGANNPLAAADYFEGAAGDLSPASSYTVIVLTTLGYASPAAAEDAIAAQSTSVSGAIILYFDTGLGFARAFVDSNIDNDDNVTVDAIRGGVIANFTNIVSLTGLAGFSNTDFYMQA